MEMTLNIEQTQPVESGKTMQRYAYSILKDPVVRDLLKRDWLIKQGPLLELIAKTQYLIQLKKISSRKVLQEIVDTVYETVIEELHQLCSKHLPKYHPEDIKSSPDYTQQLEGENSTRYIIRTFKRSQRAFSQSQKFQSREVNGDILEEAVNHFNGIYTNPEGQMSAPDECAFDLASFKLLECNEEEIEKIIKKYSSTKSGGPDGLSANFFKTLSESPGFISFLQMMFNTFFMTSTTPSQWNISHIHLLMKDTAQPFIDKSRPVSLTNILRRFFEKVLLHRSLGTSWAHLHPNQAGFRAGWSTISHILLNDELCRSKTPISTYLDLKNAFDMVDHQYLIRILEERKCPQSIINLIQSLMIENCKSRISVNHRLAKDEIRRTRGLFQGSILSPFLFNLVIDELAQRLSLELPELSFLLFADDIVLKTKDWTTIQRALDICYDWSLEAKLSWGINKCGVVSNLDYFPIVLGDAVIPWQTEYKYLGLPTTAKGVDWEGYLLYITERSRNFINALKSKKTCWNYHSRLVIYRTFIRPIVEYCLPLLIKWINKQTKKNEYWDVLLNCYSEGLEWIFDKSRPSRLLQSISGLGSFQFRTEQLIASAAYHLRSLDPVNPLTVHYKANPISNNRNFIISGCFESSLLSDWNRHSIANENPTNKYSYKGWIKHQKLLSIEEIKKDILPRYVLKRSRKASLFDGFLLLPLQLARKLLSWRCNTAFLHATCPVCGSSFTRGHLNRCGLLELLGPGHLQTQNSRTFQEDLTKLKLQGLTGDGYSPLDFYANNQDYVNFLDLYDQLRKIIYKDND
jgi:hypothetical protein